MKFMTDYIEIYFINKRRLILNPYRLRMHYDIYQITFRYFLYKALESRKSPTIFIFLNVKFAYKSMERFDANRKYIFNANPLMNLNDLAIEAIELPSMYKLISV
ncbi:hypothetical protein V1478_010327 [Vespula squamosa]|uniref:Uncharacterized protein n=1 Tax=Vespula squamosa TaxID=30214 RepID=A0ABD2AHG3_VESSQ